MKSAMPFDFVSNLKSQISNQWRQTSGYDSPSCHLPGKSTIRVWRRVAIRAERAGQLDPQSLAVQSVGVLIGSRLFIARHVAFVPQSRPRHWCEHVNQP
jgi:hypothetical protein